MSLFFFDTSALVKIYHEERGSKACLDLYLGTSTIAVSELARVELYSAVFRKLREREINEGAAGAVLQRFEEDCRTRFEVYHVASLVYEEAVALLEQYASRMALRTLDALQLATYLTYREREADVFVSFDERLCRVADAEGANVLRV
ncbi:type II toxin-antitoxin system VapC family toxin [Deferrisoma sp.]